MDKGKRGCNLNVISLDDNEDVRGAHHVASDSDGEVYCDSVDQFGMEEVRLSSRDRNPTRSSLAFVSVNHPIEHDVFRERGHRYALFIIHAACRVVIKQESVNSSVPKTPRFTSPLTPKVVFVLVCAS